MSTAPLDLGTLGLSLAVALAAGLVGCFAVMRRMTLAADPMSHIALPGIGLALALRSSPIVGALGMLLVGAVLIWVVERRTRLATEAVIGVTFSVALAIGSAITSGEDLIDALFGSTAGLSGGEILFGMAACVAVVAFVLRFRNALIVSLVSQDLASTSGVDVARLELCFLLAFALTIGLGLRYLGVLLMGSLIIIPACIAKRFARGLKRMLVISVGVALASTVGGMSMAAMMQRPSGPFIVMIAGGIFFLSLLKGQ